MYKMSTLYNGLKLKFNKLFFTQIQFTAYRVFQLLWWFNFIACDASSSIF